MMKIISRKRLGQTTPRSSGRFQLLSGMISLAVSLPCLADLKVHPQGVVLSGFEFVLLTALAVMSVAGLVLAAYHLQNARLALKEARQQFLESQNRLQAMLEALPDLMFEMDIEGRYYECYSLRHELLIVPLEELLGKTVIDVLPPEAADTVIAALRAANATGLSTGKQIALPLESGLRWFEISVARKKLQPNEGQRFIGLSRDITERKRLEHALAESERHFRSLIETWPDEIARYDAMCKRVYVNPAMRSTLSGSQLGLTPTESYPDSPTVRFYERKLREVLKTGVTQDFELQWDSPSEKPLFRALRLVAERNQLDEIVGVFAIARDVTEAKMMEGVLRESERQFRTLTENLPDSVCRLDNDLRITYVNAQLAAVLRTRVQDLIGRPVPGDGDSDVFSSTARRVLDSGRPGEIEMVLPDRGQGERHHHVRMVAERNESGNIIGVLAIGRDMTERKRLENDLRVREQYQRALLDNFPFMVWLKDTESRLLAVNRAYLKAAGLPADAPYFGLTDLDLFPPEHAEKYRADDREVMRSGVRKTVEELVGTVGNLRWHETGKTPVFDENGHLLGTVGYARDITLQKEAQSALVAREREFRTLAENAPDNICRYDATARIVYVNPVLERTLHLPREEMLGKTPLELSTFPYLKEYDNRLRRVIATGQSEEYELVFPGAGDVPQHHMVLFAPERDETGGIIGVLAIGRDITHIKLAEAELQKREREFRTLAENMPDALVRFDRNLKRIYVNKAYLRNARGGIDQILGTTPLEHWFVESPKAKDFVKLLRRVMRTGRIEELILEIPDEGGEVTYHTASLVPEYNPDGTPAGVLGISRDITSIKHMESLLRNSEQEFRTLAENSPEMIVRYDRNTRCIYTNPACERQSGITFFAGKAPHALQVWKPVMTSEEYASRLKRVMDSGIPDQILLEWLENDGTLVSHEMHAVAEYGEEGSPVGVLVIGHDISALKAAERRLEESRTQLRAMTAQREVAREEERKRIAREIHDELGQLLSVLRLNVTTIDYLFGDANADLRSKTANMVTTVDRAIMMVRSLATRLRPAVLDAGLGPALEWMVHEFSQSTGIACDLQRPADELSMDSDRAMVVFRIVQESLTNVLRHAQATQVEISLRYEGQECEVQVHDNGKGFNPANARRDSFGIVGMRERTLMLDGKMEIASEPGKGTTITVRIPLEKTQ